MAKQRQRHIRTRPYKEITIKVHPDSTFARGLTACRTGKFARGITSGLSIQPYLAFLFEVNEYLPGEHKLTDFQIAKCVAEEFPDRKHLWDLVDRETGHKRRAKKGKRCGFSVATYRQRYNSGKLVYGTEGKRFGPISFRYNIKGERLSRFSNNPLCEGEYKHIMRTYGPEVRTEHPPFEWKAVARKKQASKKKQSEYDSFDWCI